MSSENEYEYCPRCDANLTLQKGYSNDLPYWVCKGCGEMLINPAVDAPDDVAWICDECGAMLNVQEGFENNNGDYAYEQLNKLKYQIEKKTFKYKEFTFYVTMTFGLEEYDDSLGLQKTIEHADSKLYQGKSEGRNRVIY